MSGTNYPSQGACPGQGNGQGGYPQPGQGSHHLPGGYPQQGGGYPGSPGQQSWGGEQLSQRPPAQYLHQAGPGYGGGPEKKASAKAIVIVIAVLVIAIIGVLLCLFVFNKADEKKGDEAGGSMQPSVSATQPASDVDRGGDTDVDFAGETYEFPEGVLPPTIGDWKLSTVLSPAYLQGIDKGISVTNMTKDVVGVESFKSMLEGVKDIPGGFCGTMEVLGDVLGVCCINPGKAPEITAMVSGEVSFAEIIEVATGIVNYK